MKIDSRGSEFFLINDNGGQDVTNGDKKKRRKTFMLQPSDLMTQAETRGNERNGE